MGGEKESGRCKKETDCMYLIITTDIHFCLPI